MSMEHWHKPRQIAKFSTQQIDSDRQPAIYALSCHNAKEIFNDYLTASTIRLFQCTTFSPTTALNFNLALSMGSDVVFKDLIH